MIKIERQNNFREKVNCMAFYGDSDAQETQEWQEAFDSVLQHMGTERAAFLLEKLY